MLSKFTYTANLGRAAVTLDLLQVGVILMHFLGRLGELPTVYMMTRKPIYLILQLRLDLNLGLCLLTLILILAFGIYYFQVHFHTIYFKVVSIITP